MKRGTRARTIPASSARRRNHTRQGMPVASGIGGGSADAAAALRLLTSLWQIDPQHAEEVAPELGSDVPACLLSLPMRGEGAGDKLSPIDLPKSPARRPARKPTRTLSTAEVFARWDGRNAGRSATGATAATTRGAGDRAGATDRDRARLAIGCSRASKFGACPVRARPASPCSKARQRGTLAAEAVPREWWRLATFLR